MRYILGDFSLLSNLATPSLHNYMPPLVTRERFAEMCGLSPGVIAGFVSRGYIPTISVGKYSLINVELLRKLCLEREFSL